MYRSSRWTLIITTLPQAKSIVYEEHITSEYLASLKCVHYLKCKAFIGCSLEKSHHFNRSVCCCISLLVCVAAARYLCLLLPRATCVCCCIALLVFVVASRYLCLLLHRATCVCCCVTLLVFVVAGNCAQCAHWNRYNVKTKCRNKSVAFDWVAKMYATVSSSNQVVRISSG